MSEKQDYNWSLNLDSTANDGIITIHHPVDLQDFRQLTESERLENSYLLTNVDGREVRVVDSPDGLGVGLANLFGL